MYHPRISQNYHLYIWRVVLTILKNISQWEGLSHILWKIKNVWNHQPCIYIYIKYIHLYIFFPPEGPSIFLGFRRGIHLIQDHEWRWLEPQNTGLRREIGDERMLKIMHKMICLIIVDVHVYIYTNMRQYLYIYITKCTYMYRYMYIIDIRMYRYIYIHTLHQQSKLTMEHPLPTLIGGGKLDLVKALHSWELP